MPYNPMMGEDQLEGMYPRVYAIVYPRVQYHVHMMHMKHGFMHIPDREELEEMNENIYKDIEHDMDHYFDEDEYEDEEREREEDGTRQYHPRPRRRRFGRDLITILLLRELLGRRRPYPYGNYGGYMGY